MTRLVQAPQLHPLVVRLRHGLISTTTNGSRLYLITTTLFRTLLLSHPDPAHMRAEEAKMRQPSKVDPLQIPHRVSLLHSKRDALTL